MAIFTRNRREQRLIGELLTQAATIRELRATRVQLLAEAQQMMQLVESYRDFPTALRTSVDQLTVANEDLRQIEARHGIQRPSRRTPSVPPDDFAALWRSALSDPH